MLLRNKSDRWLMGRNSASFMATITQGFRHWYDWTLSYSLTFNLGIPWAFHKDTFINSWNDISVTFRKYGVHIYFLNYLSIIERIYKTGMIIWKIFVFHIKLRYASGWRKRNPWQNSDIRRRKWMLNMRIKHAGYGLSTKLYLINNNTIYGSYE